MSRDVTVEYVNNKYRSQETAQCSVFIVVECFAHNTPFELQCSSLLHNS